MDQALRALNRFGMGARVGERVHIASDVRGWLRSQLDDGAPQLPAKDLASAVEIGDALRGLRALTASDQEARKEARRRLVAIAAAEARAALGARVTSERPFVERLVAFWSNHLCVAAGAKVPVAPLAGSYERDAIRPHVLGRFEDMLIASAHHPAMLVYLDNAQSIGPGSLGARAGSRGRAQRGLNENYARELLELHTLGVDGGYTQSDVIELARVLTGWTVVGLGNGRLGRMLGNGVDDGAVRFAFVAQFHEPGVKRILGIEYGSPELGESEPRGERGNEHGTGRGAERETVRESEESEESERRAERKSDRSAVAAVARGEAEGVAALCALARHPATANFIARKLVRHFVADAPPDDAVESVAGVFRATDGDLRAVAGALVDLPHAWQPEAHKFRTPQDWLVAVLRAFDAEEANDPVLPVLRQLRQPLWSPPSPKGYGDATQEWADPDALLNRAELARTIARGIGRKAGAKADPGARAASRRPSIGDVDVADVDPRALLDVVDVAAGDPLRSMLADTSIDAGERLSLALAGPAFQWR